MKTEAMSTPRSDSFAAFLRGGFRLEQADFKILPGISVGLFAVTLVVLALLQRFTESDGTAPLGLGLPGLFLVIWAALGGLIESISVFTMTYRNGVHMSEPRHRMTALAWALSLAQSGLLLALAFVLDKVWYYGFGLHAADVAPFLSEMPWWGWGLIFVLPAAIGCFGGGAMALFGRRAGKVLYALFLVSCFSPSFLDAFLGRLPENTRNAFFAALPWLGFLLAAVCAVSGTWMLLHASVGTEG